MHGSDLSAYQRSITRPVSKLDVINEYTLAARAADDHDKAKWGSAESMRNRFDLAIKTIEWSAARSWLDIGCGAGTLFDRAAAKGVTSRVEMTGIDITPAVIDDARRRNKNPAVRFVRADFEQLAEGFGRFDVVSMIGVLQQCGVGLDRALKALARVTAPGGQLFIDTKNLGWRSFENGELVPDPSHSWFDWDEIAAATSNAGFKVVNSGGFLPREGQVVPMHSSHNLFLLARRT
jgi:ubiquinone/menaquinone biosynthesis C-methylase UbiE